MVSAGDTAPSFELPGVVDGEQKQIALDEQLDEQIVILVFYPGDFLTSEKTGQPFLSEIDLLTMQAGLAVFGISTDSIFSHRQFITEYSLSVPLLSDIEGAVSESYGVSAETSDEGYLTTRAVFVVDHTGTVVYRWTASSLADFPALSQLHDAIDAVADVDLATTSYCDGYAAYEEGTERFEQALTRVDEREWVPAENRFNEALDAFETAISEFETATRFAAETATATSVEAATKYVETLTRAARWFAEAADAFAAGEGAIGESLQRDALTQLSETESLQTPLDPTEFPPSEPVDGSGADPAGDEFAVEVQSSLSEVDHAKSQASAENQAERSSGSPVIDDEELEEITAELEAHTENTAETQDGRASGASDSWRAMNERTDTTDVEQIDLEEPTESNETDSSERTDGPTHSR